MSLLDDVNALIEKGVGEPSRLEHIKQTIENNKQLYRSDRNYLDSLIRKHLGNSDKVSEQDEELSDEITEECKYDDTFCPKCGKSTDNQNEFCPKCGVSLNGKSHLVDPPRYQRQALTRLKTELEPEKAYNELLKEFNLRVDLEVSSTVSNQQITFNGERRYSKGLVGLLIGIGFLSLILVGFADLVIGVGMFLFMVVVAVVYKVTRPYKKMVINIEPEEQGSTVIIIGERTILTDIDLYEIAKSLGAKHEKNG